MYSCFKALDSSIQYTHYLKIPYKDFLIPQTLSSEYLVKLGYFSAERKQVCKFVLSDY